jgi:acetylornithine deacetylase
LFANARLAELVEQGKHCSVDTNVHADVPPLAPHVGPAEPLARAAAQYGSEAIAVSFATEGGQFQQAGWSTVVCGPGSIEQAHKPDEFIERSELETCEAFLDRSVAQHCQ